MCSLSNIFQIYIHMKMWRINCIRIGLRASTMLNIQCLYIIMKFSVNMLYFILGVFVLFCFNVITTQICICFIHLSYQQLFGPSKHMYQACLLNCFGEYNGQLLSQNVFSSLSHRLEGMVVFKCYNINAVTVNLSKLFRNLYSTAN